MNVEITLEDTGIPRGIRHIAEQLPVISELSAGDDVSLVFAAREFVYLTGLTMLASWRKSLPVGVIVRVDDSACENATCNFLSNTGFREIVETGHERPSARRRLGKIPLQPITNRLSKEATVAEITSIFDEFSGHVEDSNPFKTLLSELGENVLAHSEAVSPGYACARVLESSTKTNAEICICDSGIGMRESFLQGTNDTVIERIRKGANPLEIAVEGLNSSKPRARQGSWESYYGFGLLITRRLVEENRGLMVILSGDQELVINHYGMETNTVSQAYPGTFVGIVLDLDNPLPLDEIYQEASNKLMPALPQATSADTTKSSQTKESDLATISDEQSTNAFENNRPEVNEKDISQSKLELRHYGTELLTREVGVVIRADLATKLISSNCVDVSFEGISDITPSVVDEALGKLALEIGFDEFSERVAIKNGSPLIHRLIEFVLKTRQSRA